MTDTTTIERRGPGVRIQRHDTSPKRPAGYTERRRPLLQSLTRIDVESWAKGVNINVDIVETYEKRTDHMRAHVALDPTQARELAEAILRNLPPVRK